MRREPLETPWFWEDLEVRLREQTEQETGRSSRRAPTWLPSLSQVGVGIGVAASLLAFSMVSLLDPVRFASVEQVTPTPIVREATPVVIDAPFDDTTAASHRDGALHPGLAQLSLDRLDIDATSTVAVAAGVNTYLTGQQLLRMSTTAMADTADDLIDTGLRQPF